MIFSILLRMRSLLGGGTVPIILAFTAIISFQYWQNNRLQKLRHKLEAERDSALYQVRERDSLLAAQKQQFDRNNQTERDLDHVENLIKAYPEARDCVQSPSIQRSLRWLREREATTPPIDDD